VPLRLRLQQQAETVQDFEISAEERFYEGLEALTRRNLGAGMYLMGYAAEMLLKNAVFRFNGASLADPIYPQLGPARARGRNYGNVPLDESFHSLQFWFSLLCQDRAVSQRPLAPALHAQGTRCVQRLYENWWVEMRYRPDQATGVEAEEVLEDVGWLWENYLDLWR
jgi:hypothetical protein